MAKEGHQARRGALDLLDGVLDQGRMLGELTGSLSGIPAAERARAQRLATLTLRQLNRCDAILKPRLRQTPPVPVLNVLRLAVAELYFDNGAAHGVVDGAVNLVKSRKGGARMAGFTNAVLRRVIEDKAKGGLALPPAQTAHWLRTRLIATYGEEAVVAMEAVQAQQPPLDLTLRGDRPKGLAGEDMPNGSVRLANPGQITALPGFDDGAFWVQDAAAAMAVPLLAPKAGEVIADLCAAPGGKTLQLAAAGAQVTAVDSSDQRMKRVRENLNRSRLTAELKVIDALKLRGQLFDGILLDAPCSATGTLRRHPDLAYVKDGGGIGKLIALQARMIDKAVTLLKPGGRLVFCTCSLFPEEGEHQVKAALARHPKLSVNPTPLPGADPTWQDDQGGWRLRPDYWAAQGGMDGFYIARLDFKR